MKVADLIVPLNITDDEAMKPLPVMVTTCPVAPPIEKVGARLIPDGTAFVAEFVPDTKGLIPLPHDAISAHTAPVAMTTMPTSISRFEEYFMGGYPHISKPTDIDKSVGGRRFAAQPL